MNTKLRYLTFVAPLLALVVAGAGEAPPPPADHLMQQLQSEVKADQAQIQMLQGKLKVTILDDLLFPEGSAQLSQQGKEALLKLVPTLKGLKDTRIVVAGYTDNLPILPAYRDRYPTNWELGAARSAEVVRFLQAEGVNPDLMAAESYGARHMVASNDTATGRSKNRRTEVTLVGPGT
jgi:chemotaxis protein MotB